MWPWAKMRDAGIEVFDGPHATPPKADSGPVFLGISNINSGRLNTTDVEYIQEEYFTKWTRRVTPQAGDIVFSYETRLGEAAMIPAGLRCCLGRRMGLLRCNRSVVEPRFLLYLYLSPGFQEFLESRTLHGSTVNRLPVGDFPEFEIPVPPLSEQRAIASVLGALDDKIELNRQMNRTLEEMAAALFKSWFVDFDPVHAKAEGRRPFGMDDETAALFPDRFVETDEGPVPEGWTQCVMDDAFELTMGQSPPGSTYNEEGEGLIFFQGRRDFGVRYPTPRVYCTAPTRYARSGDTLVSVRAPVGDANLALVDCCIGRGLAAVRHRSGVRGYTYQVVKALRPVFDTFEGEGTVFGSINGKAFKALPILEPTAEVVARFESTVSAWDDLVETNENESTTLADLRDTLLSKLLSGEIRLKQAEMAVEGIVL